MVQFYPWRKFHFLLFQAHYVFIIHYHTQKQKKTKFKPRIKLNHNIYIQSVILQVVFRVFIKCWQLAKILPEIAFSIRSPNCLLSILAVYQKHNENSWCFKQPDWSEKVFEAYRQTRRSETFCLTWGGAFGSG